MLVTLSVLACGHSHSMTAPPLGPPDAIVNGTVTSDSVGPLAGVTVVASSAQGNTVLPSVVTDAVGHFTIDHVPQGDGTVSVASLPPYCESTTPVSFVAATDTSTVRTTVDVSCHVPIGTITGTVWGSVGYVMAGATVVVTPQHGATPAAVMTDTNGQFTITKVPVGGGSVRVTVPQSGCTAPNAATYTGLAYAGIDTVTIVGSCAPPPYSSEIVIGAVNIAGLFLMQSDGSDIRVLSTNKSLEADSWSPDGRRLVGPSLESPAGLTGFPLMAYDTDGTHARQLTSGAYRDENAAWSPRGDRIAFTSQTSIDNVWAVDTDGTHLTQLTNTSGQSAWPTWSPDGSQIAYMSEGNGRVAHIWVMNADGSNAHQLTTDPPGDGQPAWSPDGSHIAFVSQRDGYLQIYVMNTDGSGQTRLTNDTLSDQGPFFSPDGSQIAFTETNVYNQEALLIMNTDGSSLRVLRGNVSGGPWKPYPPASSAARAAKRSGAVSASETQRRRR